MTEPPNPDDLRAVLAAATRDDFLTFVGRAIPELDHRPLDVQPHVEMMAAALDLLFRGETNALMINIAPRLLKSRLASVCYPAWLIGRRPAAKVMVVSHDQRLADRFVDAVRTLMSTPWYAEAFPHVAAGFEHARTGDLRTRSGAEVMAKSIDGGVTGFGYDLMIFDDPIDAGDANNATARERVAWLYDSRFRSRLDDKGKGQLIIVAQRTHRDDLCGHVASEAKWTRLVLPLVAAEDVEHRVGDRTWRRPAGHVLDLTRYSMDWVEDEQRLRPQLFAAQCQQEPMLVETPLLKRDWFKLYEGRHPLAAHDLTVSVDCAASLRAGSAFTCMLVWASDGVDHYLIEVVRDRMLIDAMEQRLLALILQHRPRTVLIEEASSGAALIRSTQRALAGTHLATAVKIVKPTASKADRLARHVDIFANGHVFVPSDRPFGAAFVDEHLMFEAGGYSDQVDATSQYFDHVHGVLVSSFPKVLMGLDRPPQPPTFKPYLPKDRSTLRKPAHGEPSLRDPKRPRPRRF
ncbi:MAG TPA: phage terminase large subunit [Caulobacteraceae bacterium]|nr:phage terminase large subunit [Caulobacteraceae bacterium]